MAKGLWHPLWTKPHEQEGIPYATGHHLLLRGRQTDHLCCSLTSPYRLVCCSYVTSYIHVHDLLCLPCFARVTPARTGARPFGQTALRTYVCRGAKRDPGSSPISSKIITIPSLWGVEKQGSGSLTTTWILLSATLSGV